MLESARRNVRSKSVPQGSGSENERQRRSEQSRNAPPAAEKSVAENSPKEKHSEKPLLRLKRKLRSKKSPAWLHTLNGKRRSATADQTTGLKSLRRKRPHIEKPKGVVTTTTPTEDISADGIAPAKDGAKVDLSVLFVSSMASTLHRCHFTRTPNHTLQADRQ